MDNALPPGSSEELHQLGNSLRYIASQLYYAQVLHTVPRYRDLKSLVPYGYRVYSQNDEDGIIAEIMRRVGRGSGFFVEFGAGDGLENNTLHLLLQGWRGTWIEADGENLARIEKYCGRLIRLGRLGLAQAFVNAENVEGLFASLDIPAEFDLLSIDIDGNDYWVWRALRRYGPRIVVIEYNAGMGPHADWKINYDPTWRWGGSRNFGASLKALELLGREMGYCLVGCSIKGMNAFFVREDLVGDRFQAPYTSEFHFESPKYYLWFSTGHHKDAAEIDSFADDLGQPAPVSLECPTSSAHGTFDAEAGT